MTRSSSSPAAPASSAATSSAMLRRAGPTGAIVNLDALTYAGNLENLARGRGATRATPSCTATSRARGRRARVRRAAAAGGVASCTSRPRATSTARSSRACRSCARTCSARRSCSTRPRAQQVERFVHVSTDEVYGSLGPSGLLHRGDAARAELARTRPARPPATCWCAPPSTRTASPAVHHALLEQLRAVPVPREAHPADDRQRPGRQAVQYL